jgi:hypothetical protein
MYIVIVLLLMLVFPLASIVVERHFFNSGAGFWLLIGKWFVFWGVGVRLVLAGLRQIFNPRYTAETVLGLKTAEPWIVVRELGFANLALGVIAVASLLARSWLPVSAVAGAIFYGLAGINHVFSSHRNRLQTVAMVSNFFICGILLAFCLAVAARWAT